MKIAKKVLAVVMAIAMIGCLTAMAFAASGSIKLVPGEVKDGKLKVALVAENCAGLTSADLVIEYDTAVLKFNKAALGKDAKLCADTDNTFSGLGNETEAGKVAYAFNFLTSLDADEFLVDDESIGIDAANFEVAILNFDVIGTAASTEIKLTGAVKDADAALAGATVVFQAAPTEPSSADASKEPSKEEEKPSTPAEVSTDAGNKTDNGAKTGDNMALAAAAGVVALAGAAFIISKKRK